MVNTNLFARLVPLQSLMQTDRTQLAKQSNVLTFEPGQTVFTRGELARTQAYLLDGEIELQSETGRTSLHAQADDARYALAPGHRRSATAVASKTSQVLFIDADMLDLMLTWSQTGGVDAKRAQESNDDDTDWMTALLQSKVFLRVPPGNIAQIFASLEAVSFSPGQDIIQQGSPGDYYYIITDGRVQILLLDQDSNSEEELAQLGPGKAFGEEALVSGAPRNATVRALSRCTLMRLSGAHFQRLLRAPLLQEVALSDLKGNEVLIDVRFEEEFAHGHLPGAINIPLNRLRERSRSLDPKKEYCVYCETGRRSSSGTFLLSERGFMARFIRAGVPPELCTERSDL
jgi:CRP-like cAMP-binding protein